MDPKLCKGIYHNTEFIPEGSIITVLTSRGIYTGRLKFRLNELVLPKHLLLDTSTQYHGNETLISSESIQDIAVISLPE